MADQRKGPAKSKPRVRTMLVSFYALPVLMVLAVVAVLAYRRVAHVPPPVHHVSTSPFALVPIGDLTASVFTDGPALRAGPHSDDVIIEFRDAHGALTNVGGVTFSLSLKSPDMVVHSIGRVFNTATPGQFRTTVSPSVAGDWTLTLGYTNSSGAVEATAPIKVI